MENNALKSLPLPTPPMLAGRWPLLGHALAFAKDRGKLFRKGYNRLGDVFAIQLGTQPAAVLIGPKHHALFYKETDHAFDMSKPYQFLEPIFGQVAFVADHATYMNQRPVLYSPFQKEKMLKYLDIMDETMRKWVRQLPDEGRLELTDSMNLLVQEVAGRAIMGDEFMTRAGKRFWELYTVVGKALDPLLPPNLPLPKFIRRNKARREMLDILRPILEDRRNRPEAFDDFLQDFINTPLADGGHPNDEQVLGMIIALLFAGHETTAGQAAWSIIQLLQHPGYLAKVKQELDENLRPGERMDPKVLARLGHVKWAIDETTRMKPSADIQIRVAAEDIVVGGYRIAKGWPVFITGEVSHFLPEVFPAPGEYDPERFSSSRNEHKAHKHAIMGFGGGMHKCPGMNFALNEMMVIIALWLQEFDLTLETKDPQVRRDLGANRPTETWVTFKRRPARSFASEAQRADAAAKGCPFAAKAMQGQAQSAGIEEKD